MAFCNFSLNFNIFNNCGLNNLFTPFSGFSFSSFNMPIFNCFNFSAFSNFNMPSLFNYPSYNMGNFMPYQSFNSFEQAIFNYQQQNCTTFTPSANSSLDCSSLWNQTSVYTMPSFNVDSVNFSTTKSPKKSNLASGIPSNYNATLGKRISQVALKNSAGKFTKKCAKYVKNALKEAGAAEYEFGHAYQMIEILNKNKNFKQISPNSVNVNDLPAGCVLVYTKGAQGYSPKYGHTEITTGDGRGVSDGITNNLRKPSAIFVPVTA